MKSTTIRFSGIAAILGGIYLLFLAAVQASGGDLEDQTFFWQTIMFMPVLLTLGAVGLFSLANGRRNVQIGAIVTALGAILMVIGFGLMTWLDSDNGWSLMFLGMVLHPIGILIFGLANRQAKVLPRWNGVPLVFGTITTFLILFSIFVIDQLDLFPVQTDELLFGFFLLLLAVGWIVMGIAMLRGGQETAVALTTTSS